MTAFISAYLRNTRQGLLAPLSSALNHASLLRVLIRRDIANRTSGTIIGGFWPIIQTALQVLGFWFLFDVVYGMRLANPGESFLEYLLVGILPWLCLVEVLCRASTMFGEFSPLYRRNPFPLEILPLLIMVIPGCVFTLVYVAMVLLILGPMAALAALPVIPLLLLWLLPFTLLFPVLGLFMKDFAQALPFLLTFAMYATPILYFPSMLPDEVAPWLLLNPFADLVALIHGAVQGHETDPASFVRLLLLWLALLGPAWLVFQRSQPHIREVL